MNEQQVFQIPDSRDLASPIVAPTAEVRRQEASRKCPVHGAITVPDCPYCESRNN